MNDKFKIFKDLNFEKYGDFYKVELDGIKNNNSKLILVTSINPTPSGEGKTTTLIGINDSLNFFGLKSIACLRQPSMGPFFGIKGGATGSGECEIQNPDKINCGFTGDFYDIEAANNLILATLENEIYWETSLDINHKKIFWNRCVDVNDRSLKNITYKIKDKEINTSFTITAASNLMALFCLCNDKHDFRNKLNNTIISLNNNNEPIFIKDLQISDSIMMILDKALKPNIAFSKYENPIIIHGGPFANIAHGCNSILATRLGMNLADYVLTEAGFGSDLGAEKFLNIKCREMGISPSLVVIAITLKAVKYNASSFSIDDEFKKIEKGFLNVLAHMESIKNFGLNFCVVINKFDSDDNLELKHLKQICKKYCDVEISTMWNDGPKTSKNIKDMIVKNLKDNKIKYTYNLDDDIYEKIEKICRNVYGASKVNFSNLAKQTIEENKSFIKNYYICNAKNQYSLSSDPSLLGRPENFEINVDSIQINHAAKFIIPVMSKIFLMPGLPKIPNAKKVAYVK